MIMIKIIRRACGGRRHIHSVSECRCSVVQIFCAPSFDDKILEVVAVFGGMQMAVSRVIKLQHHRIAQVRSHLDRTSWSYMYVCVCLCLCTPPP